MFHSSCRMCSKCIPIEVPTIRASQIETSHKPILLGRNRVPEVAFLPSKSRHARTSAEGDTTSEIVSTNSEYSMRASISQQTFAPQPFTLVSGCCPGNKGTQYSPELGTSSLSEEYQTCTENKNATHKKRVVTQTFVVHKWSMTITDH